jgi:hypothetical protein
LIVNKGNSNCISVSFELFCINFQYSEKLELPILLSPLVSVIVNKGNCNSIIYVSNFIFIWQLRCLRRGPLRCAKARSAARRPAPLRGGPLHCAEARSAARRPAPLRGGPLRCGEVRSAAGRPAPLRGSPLRCAEVRSAARRPAPLRGSPLRCAEDRSASFIEITQLTITIC